MGIRQQRAAQWERRFKSGQWHLVSKRKRSLRTRRSGTTIAGGRTDATSVCGAAYDACDFERSWTNSAEHMMSAAEALTLRGADPRTPPPLVVRGTRRPLTGRVRAAGPLYTRGRCSGLDRSLPPCQRRRLHVDGFGSATRSDLGGGCGSLRVAGDCGLGFSNIKLALLITVKYGVLEIRVWAPPALISYSGLRNRAFARPQFLISTKESAKIF